MDRDWEVLCGVGGIAGFSFWSNGAQYVIVDLFTGNNSIKYGPGRAHGYSLHKDTAGHGGKAWKLVDRNGRVIASLYSSGKIACDRFSTCAA